MTIIQAKGYSLWLMPKGELCKKLKRIISELSKKYSVSNFQPHVTLVSEIIGSDREVLNKTDQLATLIRPYKINLQKASYLNEYFRCLFIKIKKTKEVMEANFKARQIFNLQQDPPYMPHLSLMYGDFSKKIKEEIIKSIGKEFNLSFLVSSLHLYSTQGEPKDWYKIKEFKLSGRAI